MKILGSLPVRILFALIIMFAVLSGVYISDVKTPEKSMTHISALPHVSKALAKKIELSPTPIATSTPSISPTPTKPTFAGYCLQVPVIYYHHIEPLAQANAEGHGSLTVDSGIFDQQMSYLVSHGYNTIWAEDLANALTNHTPLPAKSVVVTIDDGYVDTSTVALPILEKYHVKASVFVATGLVSNPDYMTWDQVKGLDASGLVKTYDHTWSHYSLPSGDITKITYEIMTAKNQLEQYTGIPSGKIFAYPYGSSDAKTIGVLKQNGFQAAFTTTPGWTQCDSFMYSLHRNHMGNAPLSAYGF